MANKQPPPVSIDTFELDPTKTFLTAKGKTRAPLTTISVFLKGPGPNNAYTDQSAKDNEWKAQWSGSYSSGTTYTLIVTAPDGSTKKSYKIP